MSEGVEVSEACESQVRILKSLRDTELEISVVLMERFFSIGQLMALSPGSVLPFDCPTSQPAHLAVNGKAFAEGKVVQINEYYGLEVKDVVVGALTEK